MHAGSCDLLLYQHRARCTMGASCLPFISVGYRDVSLLSVLQLVCICRTRGPVIFFWVPDWAGADYVFVGAPSVNVNTRICVWVFVSWHVCMCEQRDQIPSLSLGTRGGLSLQRGRGARYASLPAKGEILFMWRGLAWQEQAANTRAWHFHRLPPPGQV